MKYARTALFSSAFAAAPFVAFAATIPTSFIELANIIVNIFNAGAILLITATIAVYFYGTVSDIYNRGRGESTNMGKNLMWGIAILFVMVSIWGIINILQNSLFGGPLPKDKNGVITYPN